MIGRTRSTTLAIAVALGLFVDPGLCEDPAQVSYLVGAVARVAGEDGSLWRSDLVLHNPGGAPAVVRLSFIERGQANPTPNERALVIDPGTSVLAEDLLATLFGLEMGAGALLIAADSQLAVSSRTFNLDTDGDGLTQTWGQFVPGINVDAFAAASLHLLPHLTENGEYRTNLGIVNLGYDDLLAWVDPDVFGGEDPKGRIYRVPANGMSQVNRPLTETGTPVDDAMIWVDTDFLSGPFLAWASVVDNRTGDAVFIPPIQPLGGEVYVPAAAHAGGINGAVWRTDLEVTGDPHLPVSYRIEWLPADSDNSNPLGVDFVLDPGQARRHVDIVGTDFGSDGVGAIRVRMLDGQVLITSRSYAVTEVGTYGQFVAGQPVGEAVQAGGEAILVHLRQSGDDGTGYRSNVGAVNVSALTIEVVVNCFAADGTPLGSVGFDLPPYGAHQVNRILVGVTPEAIDLAFAIVTTTTEGGAFLAYTSVIDNRSNDPIFIPGQSMETARSFVRTSRHSW